MILIARIPNPYNIGDLLADEVALCAETVPRSSAGAIGFTIERSLVNRCPGMKIEHAVSGFDLLESITDVQRRLVSSLENSIKYSTTNLKSELLREAWAGSSSSH